MITGKKIISQAYQRARVSDRRELLSNKDHQSDNQNPEMAQCIVLHNYVNCRMKKVIFGLICTCPRLYIGETTQELRKRVTKHISTINLAGRDKRAGRKLTSIAEHFLQMHNASSFTSNISTSARCLLFLDNLYT